MPVMNIRFLKSRNPGILFLTQGNTDHASSRIRVVQYFPFLREKGFTVTWIPRIPTKKHSLVGKYLIFMILKRINKLRIIFSILLNNYHILFIQRHFIPGWCLEFACNRGKKIVFDFDDAIYHSESDKNAETKTRIMVSKSDLVITGSPVLHNWAVKLNENCRIIPSPVDTDVIVPHETKQEKIIIGWIGSEWTSKYLEPLERVFIQLVKKYDINFLFVGAKKDILPGIEKTLVNWSLKDEDKLISQMDIGIMPLADTVFERGKGGYKIYQYMAAGIPVVVSPVGVNVDIVHEGIHGYLCSTEEEWYRQLGALAENKSLRNEMGTKGRQKVLDQYSLKICSEKLIQLMQELSK